MLNSSSGLRRAGPNALRRFACRERPPWRSERWEDAGTGARPGTPRRALPTGSCGCAGSGAVGFFCLASVTRGGASCKNANARATTALGDSGTGGAVAEWPDKTPNTASNSAITSAIDW